MSCNVIYITKKQSAFNKITENRLKSADITLLPLEDDIDEIYRRRHEADIFLLNVDEENAQTLRIVRYMLELCRDEHKSLCVMGPENFIAGLSNTPAAQVLAHIYIKPVTTDQIIEDIIALSARHEEFRRKKEILLVDDDSDFLMIIQRWLRNSYSVTGVRSGSEALQKIAEKRFDLILLDYEMPEMDGYEVMAQIRQSPNAPNTPIIFLTGLNDREHVLRIIKHRPDGYILKSTKKLALLDTLERFFAESILGRR